MGGLLRPSGKFLRAGIAAVLVAALLALALRWAPSSSPTPFATPDDCMDAYCNATKDGNVAGYLSCLAEPLRAETRRRFPDAGPLAEHLRLSMKDVKTWALHLQARGEDRVSFIDLEEVTDSRSRLTRFRLERSGKGWLIVDIGPPEEKPLSFRPGKQVDEGREGSEPRTEP